MIKKQAQLLEELNQGQLTIEELFLLNLRYKEANVVEAGSNRPILLNDADRCWVVYVGQLDVFAVRSDSDGNFSNRLHMFRVSAGQAIFGINNKQNHHISFIAVGDSQTRVLEVSSARLMELAQEEDFRPHIATLVESWVTTLSISLSGFLPPKDSLKVDKNSVVEVGESVSLSAMRGIVWVKHLAGKSRFLDDESLPLMNGHFRWPISTRTWIRAVLDSRIESADTIEIIKTPSGWEALAQFNSLVCLVFAEKLQAIDRENHLKLQQKVEEDVNTVNFAVSRLLAPFDRSADEGVFFKNEADYLFQACVLIGNYLGMEAKLPNPALRKTGKVRPIDQISRASHWQKRPVQLVGEWWRKDNGPLLGFLGDEQQPVALIPRSPRSYMLHNPQSGEVKKVTAVLAAQIHPGGYMFYRPFENKALSMTDLLKFGMKNQKYNLTFLLISGGLVSLLGLVLPILTGYIFDYVIPNSARSQLLVVSIVLLIIGGCVSLFQLLQNITLLRLQGQWGMALQAAVWDRLMALPVSFFRKYTAGDLGQRAMAINTIQQLLTGSVLNALLVGLFSIFNFFLLYYYNSQLALIATLMVFVAVGATIAIGVKQVALRRQVEELNGEISGLVLQTLSGLPKLRAAGAEPRAFAAWADKFSRVKQTILNSRQLGNRLLVFNSGYTVLTSMVIFAMVAWSYGSEMSTGTFLAFNVAFTQFLISVLVLGNTVTRIMGVVPTYERALPILQTLPEIDSQKEHPGELSGGITISRVSFRYESSGPMVLEDISMEIEPGQFVAIVGASGSGKSTLLRLLLGFEKPSAGAIYFDNHDISKVDIQEVRRQIGAVLQNGKLISGSIYVNIVGASPLSIDDAREAAQMAGMADDIKQMPMGMHTVVTDGGGTLSGGQRQRLLIARAIVHKPRILFFDEATSALDNRAQAHVSASLDRLQATRIVIAHRLSTIQNADKIFVLDKGKIIQSGKYKELINTPGLFAELAKRQIA